MQPDRFFITTSIPYVNAAPHIGHALEFVQADAFARYHRLRVDDTWFLTGTDDNSLNNVLAAEREGIDVRTLVDRNARGFIDLARVLAISNDDFIRTSIERRHTEGAQRFWQACVRAGDIYRRTYRGLYCVGCEQYYTEPELVDGLCPDHRTRPEEVDEDNYFFRLSRYAERLAELIDAGTLRIIPEARRNEVRAFIARGLEDFSVSRSRLRARNWGIGVPGDPEQVMYVWFDALTNYITALGYADGGESYGRYWLDSRQRVHVIGKGILRFHAVYWLAMLLSAGEPLPTTLFVHGYLTIDGDKISKSRGNVVDPLDLADRYGADAVRYWLLRAVPPTGDADYTDQRLEQRYTADLANDLGNLLNRTLSMLGRYRHGCVPASVPDEPHAPDQKLVALAHDLGGRLQDAMERDASPQGALVAIWQIIGQANRYVEEAAPWALAGAERAGSAEATGRLDTALYTLAETLRVIAEALRPFLPGTAERVARQLGTPLAADWAAALTWGRLPAGTVVQVGEPLFPRRDDAAQQVADRRTASR